MHHRDGTYKFRVPNRTASGKSSVDCICSETRPHLQGPNPYSTLQSSPSPYLCLLAMAATEAPAAAKALSEHLLSLHELSCKASVDFDAGRPSHSKGLSAAQAALLRKANGPNMLSPPKQKHPVVVFLAHLLGLFNLMLLVSSAACFVLLALDPAENASNVPIC